MFSGSAGTGGAWLVVLRDPGPPGEGLRNVLSVMEPELPCLSSVVLPRPLGALDRDALEDRLCMRFVWVSPTCVGGGDKALSAAAAAEAERLPCDTLLCRKA